MSAFRRSVMAGHSIRLYQRTHSNGWETWIADRGDDTFAGWACPPAGNATEVYLEDTCEHAAAAALFQLGRLSGHDTCSSGCAEWTEREPPDIYRTGGRPMPEGSSEM